MYSYFLSVFYSDACSLKQQFSCLSIASYINKHIVDQNNREILWKLIYFTQQNSNISLSHVYNSRRIIHHWKYRAFIKHCVFSKILIYFPDSVFSWCQCVYTRQAGRTPALQQKWKSSENSKKIKKKHNI